MKLINLILNNINTFNKNACICGDKMYSYRSLNWYLGSTIQKLYEYGFSAKNRVMLIADHDIDAVIFLAAASSLGLQVLMPYNLQNAAINEWNNLIDSASPDWLVYLKKDQSLVKEIAKLHSRSIVLRLNDFADEVGGVMPVIYQVQPVEDFLVLFTSGTTGQPKAISISEALICKRTLSVAAKLNFNINARIWMSGLINNTTGIIFSFGALYHGASLVFPKSREIETWPIEISGNAISHIMLRPLAIATFIDSLIKLNLTLSTLQVVAYGAASLGMDLLERAMELIPCKWIQGYGLSETFGPFCWLDANDHQNARYRKSVYCIGKPDETMEINVANGELLVRGDMLMRGYFSCLKGELIPVDEWFRTGDYVELSHDGYLNLKGRISTTLLSKNGHRIYPEEIENVMREMDGVEDALLINLYGNQSVQNAPVICINGSLIHLDNLRIQQNILSHCKRYLSVEKWPEFIALFATKFPKTVNDKVDRIRVIASINFNSLIPLYGIV